MSGLGGVGLVMSARWVVWVALGWYRVVHLAGLWWYLGLVWWKVMSKDGIWMVFRE